MNRVIEATVCTVTVCPARLFHWHHWKTLKDNGKTVYETCRCGGRRIWQRPGGYQPVDMSFLKQDDEDA